MNTEETNSKVSTKLETTSAPDTQDTQDTPSKTCKTLETTRTLTPQWKGAGNLGEFQVKTITPSVEEFNKIAREFPEAIQEFLAGQLHIKFSGPKLVAQVRDALEERHGKPEKGKSEDWHKQRRCWLGTLLDYLSGSPLSGVRAMSSGHRPRSSHKIS